jgi:cyclic pyranopterin phosphate synthase
MLVDSFGRKIDYLRISVTDRCNFRCTYCMPQDGVEWKSHAEILRYEEIVRIVSVAASVGVTKIRLTGGEPLVRRDVEYLVEAVAKTPGIEETAMTTNGSLLTREKAQALKRSGLSRVNVSLDTLDAARFTSITRGGRVEDVIGGIEAAVEAGLTPVKVNMVIFDDTSEGDIENMRSFCRQRGAQLQTIGHFSLHEREDNGRFAADRPPSCTACNRLRLTADGFLKPCLFSDKELRVNLDDIEGSIRAAVRLKPENGRSCRNRTMSQIGG